MLRQILKTKEVPERDITEMITGGYLHLYWQDTGALLVEYKKLDFEKDDDEDEEEIYYAGEWIMAKSVESQGETLLQSSLRCWPPDFLPLATAGHWTTVLKIAQ